MGAKVNGRMVPLRHKLHSGDIVEILTQSGHKPSRDWLGLVKLSLLARTGLHWLNLHQRERSIEIGRKVIEKEARKYRIALKEIKDEDLLKVASGYGLGRVDDLMSGIGYGKYSARQVLARLLPSGATPSMAGDIEAEGLSNKPGAIASVVRRVFGDHNAIMVKGQGDMLVYRARCCNPIRGESIVGYITRGKGVAVHAVSCPNVTNLMALSRTPHRREARDDSTPTAYPVKLTVYCDDRFGMLKNITSVIGDAQSNIRNIGAHTANSQASVEIVLDISDQTLGTNHGRPAQNPRGARRAAAAENLSLAVLNLNAFISFDTTLRLAYVVVEHVQTKW